jgi:2'-hydroxyisoflavone reductase
MGRDTHTMRMLVLGGSWFVGRAVVEEASRRGHDVTVFNRGLSARLPADVEHVVGDREDPTDLRSLAHRGPWDALVDPSGSIPAVVSKSAQVLSKLASHYSFVSTISVYREWPHGKVNETSELWPGDPHIDPGTRRWDPDSYGPLKVGCELAWRSAVPASHLLTLRPHVVLGPHEYVGRLPWWLNRIRRGGKVLAPAPNRGIQPVDVRDLAIFLVDQVESASSGTYNVAPRTNMASYGSMLEACLAAVKHPESPIEFVWANEDWLAGQGVTQWTELPLWRNAAAPWGMDVERAHQAGLRCRSIVETVHDTWIWLNSGGVAVDHERFYEHGIDPAKETGLIEHWLKKHL